MYRRRTGPEDLLAYRAGREWVDVRSDEINDYIHEKIGEEFSAKDFRTWHGTVLAAVALAGEERPQVEAAAKRAVSRAVNTVSEALGNTPAVCRASYIDPRVIDRFRDGATIRPAGGANGRMSAKQRLMIEREVIELVS
jgi:DNA topoisomerase IB